VLLGCRMNLLCQTSERLGAEGCLSAAVHARLHQPGSLRGFAPCADLTVLRAARRRAARLDRVDGRGRPGRACPCLPAEEPCLHTKAECGQLAACEDECSVDISYCETTGHPL